LLLTEVSAAQPVRPRVPLRVLSAVTAAVRAAAAALEPALAPEPESERA
jgi:hypothetical protein